MNSSINARLNGALSTQADAAASEPEIANTGCELKARDGALGGSSGGAEIHQQGFSLQTCV